MMLLGRFVSLVGHYPSLMARSIHSLIKVCLLGRDSFESLMRSISLIISGGSRTVIEIPGAFSLMAP